MYWRSMPRGLSCSSACMPHRPACRFGDPSTRPSPILPLALCLLFHSLPRTTVSAMDASHAEAWAAAARPRGLAAAPCHGASGVQPRERCGHPVSRGSSSPPFAPHSVTAVSLRAAEPHAHVASLPHYSSGRAEGTILGAHRTVLAPRHSSPSTAASPAGFGEVQCLLCSNRDQGLRATIRRKGGSYLQCYRLI